jgi:AAA15 family ATPase/GTPase
MILQFKIKNYRSYKDEITFTMEADSSKQKLQNVCELTLGNEDTIKALKTSIIYGANASGKTNLIKALYQLTFFILYKPKVEERINFYEPFLFEQTCKDAPSEFELTFIGPHELKYIYSIKITAFAVLEEKLDYYPSNRITNLFTRESYNPEKRIQVGTLGDSLNKKEITVFSNQLLLSKFGDDEPNELLSEVFLHFTKYSVINATNPKHKDFIHASLNKELYENSALRAKVSKLINAADTKIEGIDLVFSNELNTNNRDDSARIKDPYIIYGLHELYNESQKTNQLQRLDFKDESHGTKTLYILGGKVLSTIEKGGVLIVDELDTSLHPFLTKMIVMIFQSEKINKKNAQLIFTTHDVSLLDRELIRKDQIWFTEKDEKGVTDMYSLQDFEGLREDTPFEKWYLAGKFGGIPNIISIESLFEDVN